MKTKEMSRAKAHELNNVLGVIIGYAELLQEELEPSHPLREAVDGIFKASRQLLALAGQELFDPKVSDSSAAKSGESSSENQTILLAEDDQSLRTVTRKTLQAAGYTVLEAGDGKEALKISREHVGDIDLLLTDLVMPEMGGSPLAQRLSVERTGIKVVFMSGYTAGYTALLLGMQKFFLTKPFTRDGLIEKIREALESEVLAEAD